MNDAYDSVVTYIALSLGVFSKARSGISLIPFPPRNLKKKQNNLYLFYLSNLLTMQTMKHLKINGLKKIVKLRRGGGGGGNYILTQFHTGSSNPRSKPLPFCIPFLA